MKNKEKKLKTFHMPKQKGKLSDYWIAIYEGDVEGAETEKEAIKKILNRRKDLH